jgi:hypothetical protein
MTGMQAAGLSGRTAGAARGTLSSALSAAIADGLLQVNVARAVKAPPRPAPDPSAFSDVEMAKIAEGCRSHLLGPMFVFGALTGLRTSELIGLRWDDVDLEEGTYQVSEGLHRVGRTGADALGLDLVAGDRDDTVYNVQEFGATDSLALGLVDGQNTLVEEPETIAERVEWFESQIPAEGFDRTYLTPNTELFYLPANKYRAKLNTLAAAAEVLE